MRLAITTVATLFIAAPAYAQSRDTDFSGVRVEAVGGYSSGFDAKEAVYGGAIGFDLRTAGLIVGIEGGLTGTSGDRNGGGLRSLAGRDLNIGGRVGFVVTPRTLFYGKVGYTILRSSFESFGPNSVKIRTNFTRSGAYFGGGIEQVISGRAYVKGEYRFSTYSGSERSQLVGGVGIRF